MTTLDRCASNFGEDDTGHDYLLLSLDATLNFHSEEIKALKVEEDLMLDAVDPLSLSLSPKAG